MRVKRGVVRHRRHQKIRKLARGFRGVRRKTFKMANQAVMKAGQHAYKDRRRKKRDFRSLWIIRLNAAFRERGLKYSSVMSALKKHKIELNRKVLSELAIHEPKVLEQVLKTAGL
ncbi:MAG: 50S ribosomal protein L20 [Candidatus Peribacteraceae bacterium]|nr:50S ribosomal protein L20 [Candidatus Peribacteraceae bacterium]